uniref:ABC transporter permease n=1 Tax=Candidatus Electronema sp. TaxID=2698783 RepID=UPI004055D063
MTDKCFSKKNSKFKSKFLQIGWQLSVVLALLGAWQAVSTLFFSDSGVVPTPKSVIIALCTEIPPDVLLKDAAASMTRVIIGVLAAAVCGIGLGGITGYFRQFEHVVSPIIEFLRPISPIAWIPMAILWFGVTELSSWFIIFIAAFFPILTNTVAGVHSVRSVHRELARSLNLSTIFYFRHIVLPSTLPHLLAGLRIGLGIGWMAVIAAEMVAAQSGLGYFIQLNRFLLRSEWVLAGMFVIGVIGYLMNSFTTFVGHRLAPWAKDY